MYEPGFNSVLVQIDNSNARYGAGNDESMLGESYSKGEIIRVGKFVLTDQYPVSDDDQYSIKQVVDKLVGSSIMWNEGVEAGTTFEFDDKLFGFIYWWDVRGVLVSVK